MNVYALGASQNIGYNTATRLLGKGATVTFLLRKPSVLQENEEIRPYIDSGKVRLVKGDALNTEDVGRGWSEAISASPNGRVDTVVFSIGGAITISILKGGKVNPHNLCSQSLLNLLRTIPPSLRDPALQPRFVIVTTTGATKSSHNRLPLPMKLFYQWLLVEPHTDKYAMERVLAYCSGSPWPEDAPDYREDFLPADWQSLEGLPARGTLTNVLIVRPAFLTDGKAKGDEVDDANDKGKEKKEKKKKEKSALPYRVREGETASEGWTISRGDVAHFIAEVALKDESSWEKYQGKGVTLCY